MTHVFSVGGFPAAFFGGRGDPFKKRILTHGCASFSCLRRILAHNHRSAWKEGPNRVNVAFFAHWRRTLSEWGLDYNNRVGSFLD